MTGPQGERRRRDLLTGRWCVVAPERGRRPMEWPGPGRPTPFRGSSVVRVGDGDAGDCPFCPGREEELGAILAEDRGKAGRDPRADAPAAAEGSWRTRAVANRYPAFRTGGGGVGSEARGDRGGAGAEGDRRGGGAEGHQEVLIESPVHDWDWAGATRAASRAALDLYLHRMAAAVREHPGHRVFAFRNRGRDAGSSRSHPHGQLVAVRGVPPEVARLERRQRRHHRRRGGCVLCGSPAGEPGAAERTVLETPRHRVFTLWAPADPFHLRVVPRRHVTTFSEFEPDERADLAGLLPRVLAALGRAAGDPAYNLLFREGPGPGRPWIHAHLEIRPRFGRIAGFELLTEVALVPSDPVDDARALREALPNPNPASAPSP